MRFLVLLLPLFLSGCLTQITSLEDYVRKEEIRQNGVSSIDSLLKVYFTDEAYEALKDIPVYISPSDETGAALCTSGMSYVASFFLGCGFDRSIIIGEGRLRDKNGMNHLSHEFLHHLDDMTRDGDEINGKIVDFINIEEFLKAYQNCYKHPTYHGIYLYTESGANDSLITYLFGIGEHSERIGYCGELLWSRKDTPEDLKHAFRKIFRNFAQSD